MNIDEQYVVLARKYRPQNFDDLLGQDALVQTLSNAITNNRLHHAYVLTGIRGVGKTTTARIIAKALNCIGVDGKGGPTIKPCGVCENCKAIAADRHIDVLELDAASRTGVDDIREILDGVRYKPTSARYKIYIIDEVHMLSKNAFNALLKTLEEPPLHVKFIFATTEIRKIPATVLSRCQRFDLQRLGIEDLLFLFNKIAKAEKIVAEEEALKIIANVADGSARDGLSLLDQAISLGQGIVKTEIVKDMIGLTDKNQIFEIFENLSKGDIRAMLEILQQQYKNGANPLAILQDLVSITHLLTKVKINPAFAKDISLCETEQNFCAQNSGNISIAVLAKIWQMLLKGIGELSFAPNQIDAVEMILIRIAYSANLPTPIEAIEEAKKKVEITTAITPQTQKIETTKASQIETIGDIITLLESKKKMIMVHTLKNDVAISSFEKGKLEIDLSSNVNNEFIFNLGHILEEATGTKWDIKTTYSKVVNSIAASEAMQKEDDKKNISEHPLVKAILEEFSGAEIETLTRKVNEENIDNLNLFEEE